MLLICCRSRGRELEVVPFGSVPLVAVRDMMLWTRQQQRLDGSGYLAEVPYIRRPKHGLNPTPCRFCCAIHLAVLSVRAWG